MKLKNIKEIKAILVVKTGLHIGGSNDEIKIGGIDNPIIKNPLTNEPYIPGSSLKGKIRSLLEWHFGIVDDGKAVSAVKKEKDKEVKKDNFETIKPIVQLFGNGSTIKDPSLAKEIGPTRVSFADATLTLLNKEELLEKNALTEEKIEVTINRLTGSVGGGGPRHMERVPAGAKFDFNLTLMEFEGDSDFEKIVALGMKLLELTNLGGSGSRGYGKIEFEEIKGLDQEYLDNDNKLKSYEELKNIGS